MKMTSPSPRKRQRDMALAPRKKEMFIKNQRKRWIWNIILTSRRT
jgi:hypothetical protein